ncbi:MAG: fatty acid desaturase [Acidimicrobiia bacterium]|nr:fatty acid desaturase [Acidimicrobiia bacterium]
MSIDATAAPTERPTSYTRGPDERVNKVTSIPFAIAHLLPLLAIFTGVSRTAIVLFMVTFWGRIFFITAGYHRYFSHRAYKLARVPQFLMAFGGTMAAQKGPLWWAGHHREHHRTSDTEADIHSPLRGFWWSHAGWILCDKYKDTPYDRIKDFAKYPELRFLNRHDWIGPWALGITCFLIGGWSGLLIGFFASTVACWHATFLVNSLAHVMGRRRFATEDTSRNSAIIAVLTMGEGWHNNHHYYQASARQGFYWWEWDPSYYILRGLATVGIVKDLKVPSEQVKASNRIKEGAFDIGIFRSHWVRASEAVRASSGSFGDRLHDGAAHAAGAVKATRESLGERVHDGAAHAAEAISERREALADKRDELGESFAQRRDQLEDVVAHTLESAEELARASRLAQRQAHLGTEN